MLQPLIALHHVALYVPASSFQPCVHFYHDLLGMKIVWQPDATNIYLSLGTDNLALHCLATDADLNKQQRLDHIGFRLPSSEAVHSWHDHLQKQDVTIIAPPKTHRDETCSFYCADPAEVKVQFIYHPDIS